MDEDARAKDQDHHLEIKEARRKHFLLNGANQECVVTKMFRPAKGPKRENTAADDILRKFYNMH